MYNSPLSKQAQERLQIIRDSTDGFVIAEKDLAIRGPGEVFGIRQSGGRCFRIADLQRDKDLLPVVSKFTEKLLPQKDLILKLKERWLRDRIDYISA